MGTVTCKTGLHCKQNLDQFRLESQFQTSQQFHTNVVTALTGPIQFLIFLPLPIVC